MMCAKFKVKVTVYVVTSVFSLTVVLTKISHENHTKWTMPNPVFPNAFHGQ